MDTSKQADKQKIGSELFHRHSKLFRKISSVFDPLSVNVHLLHHYRQICEPNNFVPVSVMLIGTIAFALAYGSQGQGEVKPVELCGTVVN